MSDAVGSDRLVVRPGRTADAPGVCAVIVRAVRESTSEFYSAEQVAAWADPVNVARMMALIEQTFTIVAVAEDRVVGFSNLAGREVDQLYVDPGMGGRGVARALYQAVEQEAFARGIACVRSGRLLGRHR